MRYSSGRHCNLELPAQVPEDPGVVGRVPGPGAHVRDHTRRGTKEFRSERLEAVWPIMLISRLLPRWRSALCVKGIMADSEVQVPYYAPGVTA